MISSLPRFETFSDLRGFSVPINPDNNSGQKKPASIAYAFGAADEWKAYHECENVT